VVLRSGLGGGSSKPPLVGTPVETMKALPPADAQPEDPARGLQIYQQVEGQAPPATPNFTPPPEVPQPRTDMVPAPVVPQPSAPIAAMPNGNMPPAFKPAVVATAPAGPRPVAPKPVVPKPEPVVVLTKPQPAPTVAKAPAAKVAPPSVKVAAPVVKPAPAALPKPVSAKAEPAKAVSGSGEGAASVQIGAFSSQALADKGWNDAVKIAPGPAAGKGKKVQAVEKDGATLYRTTVTGFASRDTAAAFCNQLKAAGKNCFVK